VTINSYFAFRSPSGSIKVPDYNKGAFSFQTAYGSGKPKAVWVFNPHPPPKFEEHKFRGGVI
jgi:hypothetical protein